MDDAKLIYEKLQTEINTGFEGGLLDYTITEMSYHSNRIEGSTLTREQTQSLYDYDYVSASESENNLVKGEDVVEMRNHFRLIKHMITDCMEPLSQTSIKEYHKILKLGAKDEDYGWAVGDYKKLENAVGNVITTEPFMVAEEMENLLITYNHGDTNKDISDIARFHFQFEAIHPFQDGNGRIGRSIMLKECLSNSLIPFIVTEDTKNEYINGLKQYALGNTDILIEYFLMQQNVYIDKAQYYIPK